jgi:hypothetical protein
VQHEDRTVAAHTARTRTTICVASARDMYGGVGLGVAIGRVMNNDNMKDKIDNAADKAKDAADNAGSKIKQGAEKVSDKAHDAADKIKERGKDLGKKVGG